MNYCVYHSQKGKASGGPLGSHIDRQKGKEHTYKNADASLTEFNRNFNCPGGRDKMPMHLAIKDRINEGYNGKRKIRTDAVKFVNHTLTGSHEKMMRLIKDPEKFEAWIQENRKFIETEFGAENIVRFSLHLDEKTPHIHAVTVPLTEYGRLSWKELAGGKKEMHERQTRYHEKMQQFGFDRGKEWTGIKHENTQEYYKRLETIKNSDKNTLLEPVKGFLGIDKAKTLEKYENVINELKTALDESTNKEDVLDLKWRNQRDANLLQMQKAVEQVQRREYRKSLEKNRSRNNKGLQP